MVQCPGMMCFLVLFSVAFCILHYPAAVSAATINNNNNDNGFMESLSTGFRFASKLLGMNQSDSVANLVSQAFGGVSLLGNAPKPNSRPSTTPIYDYEDSAYSSNNKDNYLVSNDKSDTYQTQQQQHQQYPSASDDQEMFPPTTTTTTTTSAPSPTASLTGITTLLRVLGMDEKKLSALMVNGLIFIAQMVKSGTALINEKLSPVKHAFRRFIVNLPWANSVSYVKE